MAFPVVSIVGNVAIYFLELFAFRTLLTVFIQLLPIYSSLHPQLL